MLADDGSLSASYGQDAITDQTNTDTEREACTAVCLTAAETRVLSPLPTYRTLLAIGTERSGSAVPR